MSYIVNLIISEFLDTTSIEFCGVRDVLKLLNLKSNLTVTFYGYVN